MIELAEQKVFYKGKTKFEDRTGMHFKGEYNNPLIYLERPLPEELHLIKQVAEVTRDELGEYGVTNSKFEPESVRFVWGFPSNPGMAGRHNATNGYIEIDIINTRKRGKVSDASLAVVFAHEDAHALSTRIFKSEDGNLFPHRIGIVTYPSTNNEIDMKKFLWKGNVNKSLENLSEAITQKTASRIINKRYRDIQFGPYIKWVIANYGVETFYRSGYHQNVAKLTTICKEIAKANPTQFNDEWDAYKLFEQASFGEGRLLPLARVLNKTYGKSGLIKVAAQFTDNKKAREYILKGINKSI